MGIKHVISVSGGKDSAATLLIALQRFGRDRVTPIFCDTGNEHDAVYQYLDYLELALDIKIVRLKASFDDEIANKRTYIARDVRNKRVYETVAVFDDAGRPVWKLGGRGEVLLEWKKRDGIKKLVPIQKTRKVGSGRRLRWTNKAKRRALSVLRPTGNPYLDLCMWKGRFPSRKAQFCTEFLKTKPAVEFQLSLVDQGYTVVSWQGIRRDESPSRADAKKFERIGPNLYAFRPVVDFTALAVFAFCAACGIRPNPLYLQEMIRVGCMPCINVGKEELAAIARRFIEHIGRIFTWEQLVRMCSKLQAATFIPAPGIVPRQAKDRGIWERIEWAQTKRGGKHLNLNLFAEDDEINACASSYGLCE